MMKKVESSSSFSQGRGIPEKVLTPLRVKTLDHRLTSSFPGFLTFKNIHCSTRSENQTIFFNWSNVELLGVG